jgi:cyclophilin family peptidyl-prolyl cis-trans isomerase
MRAVFPLGILCATILARPLASQENGPSLGEILRVEDHRARGAGELGVLLRGLSSGDTLLLGRAVRALGRLERPALAERMLPLLAHPVATVRAEAAQAVAQSAQGFQGDSSGAPRGGSWSRVVAALEMRVAAERDSLVRGSLALALGRLPYVTAEEISQTQGRLLALSEGLSGAPLLDVVRGMGSLLRLTGRRVPATPSLLARLRELARAEAPDLRVRRFSLIGLLGAQAADPATLAGALRSADPELRRVALSGITRLEAGEARWRLLQMGLGDSVAFVRYEALGGLARTEGTAACSILREAVGDPAAAAALLAVDLLGSSCGRDASAATLLAQAVADSSGSWHRRAHALVSLARVDPVRAATLLPVALSVQAWQVRLYGARAAAVLRDTAALRQLARDSVANVREAALAGLHAVSGHADDALYRDALAAADYQLVLTASRALAGSPTPREASRALLRALARITAERRETSRDPRLAILARLRELGGPALAVPLRPYLRDFDPAVADSAAALLAAWTGRSQRPAPRRLVPLGISSAEIAGLVGKRLRFRMASGGVFEVVLLADDAPVTVLRVARLVAQGYYNGLSFHRVVPNFVIQGGSPGANEYAGYERFLRDELGPLSHERGTLGISTRGRDTGDAQLFINLVANPRLDFEYTVWGRVVSGMEVIDGMLEGEVIAQVEIR